VKIILRKDHDESLVDLLILTGNLHETDEVLITGY